MTMHATQEGIPAYPESDISVTGASVKAVKQYATNHTTSY